MNRFALTDRLMQAGARALKARVRRTIELTEADASVGILRVGDTRICADCGAEILLNTWHWDDCKFDMSPAAVKRRAFKAKYTALMNEPLIWD